MILLRVVAPEGRYVSGYGSRECGEVFDHLPDELALQLLNEQPLAFERAEPERKKKKEAEAEVNDGG